VCVCVCVCVCADKLVASHAGGRRCCAELGQGALSGDCVLGWLVPTRTERWGGLFLLGLLSGDCALGRLVLSGTAACSDWDCALGWLILTGMTVRGLCVGVACSNCSVGRLLVLRERAPSGALQGRCGAAALYCSTPLRSSSRSCSAAE